MTTFAYETRGNRTGRTMPAPDGTVNHNDYTDDFNFDLSGNRHHLTHAFYNGSTTATETADHTYNERDELTAEDSSVNANDTCYGLDSTANLKTTLWAAAAADGEANSTWLLVTLPPTILPPRTKLCQLSYLLTDVKGRPTKISREFRGALATFLTMAYILPVNASILSSSQMALYSASIVACTALAAGISCIFMGLYANFPIALASGMGLNAMVTFTLAQQAGSWQTAMGMVVLDGLIVLLLVLAGLREATMNAIPRDLRLAIGAGIGLFIAVIGLSNAGLSLQGIPAPPIGPLLRNGDLRSPQTFVAAIGLLLTATLMAWRVLGALVIGILASTALAFTLKLTSFHGVWQSPSFAVAFHADIKGALSWKLMPLLFAVIMVDFFDTLGTATAIAEEGNLQDADGKIPNVRRLLIVDSIAASIGGLLGVSSVTSYIESAAGVAEGARTGLHSIFVGLFFLAAVFLSPLASVIPPCATAPALILVGFLMMKQTTGINFEKIESAAPAFITLITIPMTFSIAHGIGYGFIVYVVIQAARLNLKSIHPLLAATAAAFAIYFAYGPK